MTSKHENIQHHNWKNKMKAKHHLLNKLLWCYQEQWLMPEVPTTWEAEIWRTVVQDQPGQNVSQTPCQPVSGCGGSYL
jgi:hypothetical protein